MIYSETGIAYDLLQKITTQDQAVGGRAVTQVVDVDTIVSGLVHGRLEHILAYEEHVELDQTHAQFACLRNDEWNEATEVLARIRHQGKACLDSRHVILEPGFACHRGEVDNDEFELEHLLEMFHKYFATRRIVDVALQEKRHDDRHLLQILLLADGDMLVEASSMRDIHFEHVCALQENPSSYLI